MYFAVYYATICMVNKRFSKARKLHCYGHAARHNCLEKDCQEAGREEDLKQHRMKRNDARKSTESNGKQRSA